MIFYFSILLYQLFIKVIYNVKSIWVFIMQLKQIPICSGVYTMGMGWFQKKNYVHI